MNQFEQTPEQIIERLRKELEFANSMRELGSKNFETQRIQCQARVDGQIALREIAEKALVTAHEEIRRLGRVIASEKTRGDDNYSEWAKSDSLRRTVQTQRDSLNAKVLQLESDIKLVEANLEVHINLVAEIKPVADAIILEVNKTIDAYNDDAKWMACLNYAMTKLLKDKKFGAIMELAEFVYHFTPDDLELPEVVGHVTINTA